MKNSDKKNSVYSGYGKTLDSGSSRNFDNGTARNVIIFSADSSSSSHVDNRNNNFLILGLGPTYGINGKFGSEEKKISINLTKATTKFCLNLHYNDDIIIMMLSVC